jgi:HEAT repeat protein
MAHFRAAEALPRIDPSGAHVVPRLLELFRQGNHASWKGAFQVLKTYGPKAAGATSEMSRLLDDRANAWVRIDAAAVLAQIGRPARAAESKLGRLLKDPVEDVQLGAAKALWRVARSTEGLPVIVAWLQPGVAINRYDGFQVLAEMGPAARDAVRPVAEFIRGPNPIARQWAVFVLGRMGREAAAAVPALRKELADPGSALPVQVLTALGQMGLAARDAVPDLRKLLKGRRADLRRLSAVALGQIGSAAREALPELTAALRDKDLQVRLAAAGALWAVDRRAKDAVAVAQQALQGADWGTQYEAVALLGRMGQDARTALPALRGALARARNTSARLHLAEALWRVSGDAQEAVGVFRSALKDSFAYNRVLAARVLGDMGASARAAVPELRKAAGDAEAGVREEAAKALKKIEGDKGGSR